MSQSWLLVLSLFTVLSSGCASQPSPEGKELENVKRELCLTKEQLALALRQRELAEKGKLEERGRFDRILGAVMEAQKNVNAEKQKTSLHFEFEVRSGADANVIADLARKLLMGKYILEKGFERGMVIDKDFLKSLQHILNMLLKAGVNPRSLRKFMDELRVSEEIKSDLRAHEDDREEGNHEDHGQEPEEPSKTEYMMRISVEHPLQIAA